MEAEYKFEIDDRIIFDKMNLGRRVNEKYWIYSRLVQNCVCIYQLN